VVVVEDTSELRPALPHVVGLEARPANAEGAGAVDLRTLVRQALRMRPDRLVVGEVRGGEVVDLLAALNTGHEGGCGTVHANSAADVAARLEGLALAAGMPLAAVHSQMAAALEAVVHCVRDRDGRRRVAEVAVLRAGADGRVSVVPAVTFDRGGRAVEHEAAGWLAGRLDR
jgi:pilus assembly protein CpaF